MRSLTYIVRVEEIPDTVTKDYRVRSGATERLRDYFGVGINVVVTVPEPRDKDFVQLGEEVPS